MKKIIEYFSKTELIIWSSSVLLITVSFFSFGADGYMTLIASLIGATFLIFNAKGNPIGQFLTIIFSLLYGVISYSFRYYGEMITYVGMTAPMALFAFIAWVRNPYNGNKAEVRVHTLQKSEIIMMCVLTTLVTIVFYFILKAFNTANLIPSTISVTTSFAAVYLTAKRSPYFAIAYALNDIVLIILWSYAAITDISYVSVIICFITFLANDIYGFINWKRIYKRQLQKWGCCLTQHPHHIS